MLIELFCNQIVKSAMIYFALIFHKGLFVTKLLFQYVLELAKRQHTIDQQNHLSHNPLSHNPLRYRHLKLAISIAAIIITTISVWPVSAAVELNYFSVVPSSRAILLEWSTAKEYNLIAFQLMCKQVGQRDDAYHPIVTKSVKGNAQEGATYDHLVTSGLTPGVPYCFRLQEITINGEPGQIFDRCGYGLNITPTPTLEARFLDETATAQAILNATEAAIAAMQPTIDPALLTLTPQTPLPLNGTPAYIATQQAIFAQQTAQAVAAATIQQEMFFATQTAVTLGVPATETAVAAALTETPTPEGGDNSQSSQPESPLEPDPGAQDPGAQDPNTNAFSVNQSSVDSSQQNPEVIAAETQAAQELEATQTQEAIETQQAIQVEQANAAAQAAQATETMQAIQAAQVVQASQTTANDASTPDPNSSAPVSPLTQDGGGGGVALAGYPYVIVTAAPTEVQADVLPTLTPLPTAIPTTQPLLASIFAPTAQNMMIVLLFVVFFSASGIGILGLLSGVFYMRSRARRRN